MFCWENLSLGIHKDITLTLSTHLNTATDQVQPSWQQHSLMAVHHPPSRALHPAHSAQTIQEQLKEHDQQLKVPTRPPNSPDLDPIEHPRDVVDQVRSTEA